MPHWKSLQGKEFLGSWDFEQGEEKVVTIVGFSSEIIQNHANPTGTEKPRVVLEFAECKKAVMNTTNCTMISEVLGSPDINDWLGKQVILHTEKVRGFGKVTDAIRVMSKKPTAYICEDCGKPIKAAGAWSAEKVATESKARFGAQLCSPCAKSRTEAAKDAEADA